MAYSSPIRFSASSVRADGVDFTAGVSPTGGFRYPAIPVQLVEPGVCIRLQYTTEPRKMGLRMDAFSVRAVSEPHRRRQR